MATDDLKGIDAYRTAPPFERQVLQLCALKFDGISRDELSHLLKLLNWNAGRGSADPKEVKLAIDSLFTKELLYRGSDLRTRVTQELLDLAVQDTLRDGTFESFARAIQTAFARDRSNLGYAYPHNVGAVQRDIRIAFYRGDPHELSKLLQQWQSSWGGLVLGLLQPFDATIFLGLPEPIQRWHLGGAINVAIHHAEGSPELLAMTERLVGVDPGTQGSLLTAAIDLSIARGDVSGLRRIDGFTAEAFTEAAAGAAFLDGEFGACEQRLAFAVKRLQAGGSKQVLVPYFSGLLQLLLLLRENSPAARSRVLKLHKSALREWPASWGATAAVVAGAVSPHASLNPGWRRGGASPVVESRLTRLMTALVWRWFDGEGRPPVSTAELNDAAGKYRELGLIWLATEAAALAATLPGPRPAAATSESVASGKPLLLDWIRPVQSWERGLTALVQLAATGPAAATTSGAGEERLIWEVEYETDPPRILVEPIVQKRTRTGWTKGRVVSIQRLHEGHGDAEFSYLDDRDRAICRAIDVEQLGRYSGRHRGLSYGFDPVRLVRALVGHPRLFGRGDRTNPITVTTREPQLIITKPGDGSVRIAIDPRPGESAVVVREDGPNRLEIVLFSDKHRRLNDIIGASLVVPESETDRVLATAQAVSSLVSIHSEIGAAGGAAELMELDPRPHLHLVPHQAGLRLELFVRPFGDAGPFFRPGVGGENVFADVGGVPRSGRRRLAGERAAARAVIAACTSLAAQEDGDSHEFHFADSTEALELLVELQPLVAANEVVLHWPQGRKLTLVGEARSSQFRVRIRKDRDWFAASGALEVDDELSLDLMRLIELVEGTPSRFIQLDDGRFLALTDELRRQVADLGAAGQRLKTKVRFAPIRAAALDGLNESLTLDVDEHWRQCVARMRAARDLEPRLPTTLEADLRDYQVEGYAWLARLAHWGVGGCLADDMGLGKTVQALALLLERGAGGPALVVCPTSVAFNWQNECKRFAPTLTVWMFGPGDREDVVKRLGPRDIAICSYGLLHHESELLQGVAWHTVILDEAQAIKNMATKRSQAVMNLEAGFRLILTGTPLENHLGELWNLFNFINPGLLGSFEAFRSQFAVPIERDDDADARRRLKQLIQPFILRRTKTQVLDALPSKTEITLQVELSKEEWALYEAVRRRALQNLAAAAEGEAQQPGHLQVLAEIMRLRRVCCHPRLVFEGSTVASSKLLVFAQTIDELRENRHRALVFSQFVGHLEVLREELDRKGVPYQYLDGSTPAAQRRTRVEAFQAGEGDVFLISLRAGGQGLNLTAADYVIHMDPWWNPAVEDQASDRAHRIGQQRPVTIYRLVAKGTIEERIVELHRSKRDLADSLLDGAEVSAKLSGEELLRLLQD